MPERSHFEKIVQAIRTQGKAHSEESANMVAFMAFSGMRMAEVQALTWENVGSDWIIVRGGDSGTKSGHERRVPIIPAMSKLLESMRYEGAAGQVFL